ncbi:MAG: hypothetical protein Q9169_005380 [Polycauliona sp. 2 TL-2023]
MASQEPDTDPQLRNILLLDKSTEPLASQVQEACSILGITLPTPDHGAQTSSQQSTRSGPREEWTLRWLLKKVDGLTQGSQSVHLELGVWLLIEVLIVRLPVANLARLLRDHHFLSIVLNTFSSIRSSYDVHQTRTLQGAMLKKKGPSPMPRLELARLFRSLCATMSQLHQLAEEDSHGCAVEHLKMALRGSSEEASAILGMSLTITDCIVHTDEGGFEEGSNIFDLLIGPWIAIWTSRSRKATQDTADLAFATNCLVPALRVLTTPNHSLASKLRLEKATEVLEDLVLQHTVNPVRNIFEASKRTRAALDDEGPGAEVGSLLAPLYTHTAYHWHQNLPRTESIEAVHPVACFYNIAMKSTPLSTSKERIANRPWLQYLFDRLSDQLESLTTASSETPKSAKGYSLAIKQMLEMILIHKSNLKTSTLQNVLSKVSHIFDAVPVEVNWKIVSLCLKIDPDVFVIPNSKVASTKAPNELLVALCTRLNGLSDPTHKASDEMINMVLQDVLVPLVEGFAHARDLINFINYWKANMTQIKDLGTEMKSQQSSSGNSEISSPDVPDTRCIWEHEELLQAVAGLLESRLTTGQIGLLLQEANTIVENATSTSGPIAWSIFSANLVILDCVLSGCTNENTVSVLPNIVQSTYVALFRLREADRLPTILRWRVWRCIATINNRWGDDFTQHDDLRTLETRAAKNALRNQTQTILHDNSKEGLHSFNFLLSVIDSERPHNEALAESTVQYVVSLLGRYAELVISHLPIGMIQDWSSYDISPTKLEELLALQQSTLHTYRTFQLDKFLHPGYWRAPWSLSDGAIYASAFENIHRMPCRVFERKQQVLVFNNALIRLPGSLPGSLQLLKDHVKLFIKLLDRPHKELNLLNSANGAPRDTLEEPTLLDIADQMNFCCRNHRYVDTEAIDLLKMLVRRVLDYQLSRDTRAQAASFLTSYYESLATYTRQLEKIMHIVRNGDSATVEPAERVSEEKDSTEDDSQDGYSAGNEGPLELHIYSIAVLAGSLDFYQRHLQDFPAEVRSRLKDLPPVGDLYLPVVVALSGWISSGRSNFTKPISEVCAGALGQSVVQLCQAAAAQYIQASYPDSLLGPSVHESGQPCPLVVLSAATNECILVSECIEDLAAKASERVQITRLSSEDVLELKEALRLLKKAQSLLAPRYDTRSTFLAWLTVSGDSIPEQTQLVKAVVDSIKDRDPESNADLMMKLVDPEDGHSSNRNSLMLLQTLIIRQTTSKSRSTEATTSALSHVINSLSGALLQPQQYQSSVLSWHCINIVLHKEVFSLMQSITSTLNVVLMLAQPRIISQWHIDQIMAAITHCASSPASNPEYSPKQTGLQYFALCRVFSTILAFHRKRLGGRYHLILLVVQALLRPLFIPFQGSYSNSPTQLYTSAHAKAYSRLLLQLADPALSSVAHHNNKKRRKGHNPLNDPTKIAKSIAGQHLHYLIMTYCECLLQGRLEKEVREGLRPGIWAVLDVVSQETMRVMNAGMDKAGRAIWKGMYEEWRRDGRGVGRGR